MPAKRQEITELYDGYAAVMRFHVNFGLPIPLTPVILDEETMSFRIKFLREELNELVWGLEHKDLVAVADAVVDLQYVAIGTAIWIGSEKHQVYTCLRNHNTSIFPPYAPGSLVSTTFDVHKWVAGIFQDTLMMSAFQNYLRERIEYEREMSGCLRRIVSKSTYIAELFSLPLASLWEEVQETNMAKIPVEVVEKSGVIVPKRHRLDIVKPPGWQPPRIEKILRQAGWEGN